MEFIIFVVPVVGIVLAWLLLSYIPVRLWVAAWAAGVKIGLWSLVGMRLRRVPPRVIVEPQINATKAGLHLSIDELEADSSRRRGGSGGRSPDSCRVCRCRTRRCRRTGGPGGPCGPW